MIPVGIQDFLVKPYPFRLLYLNPGILCSTVCHFALYCVARVIRRVLRGIVFLDDAEPVLVGDRVEDVRHVLIRFQASNEQNWCNRR
jgi:hypothetical protein